MFSVALSVSSRPPGITWRPALWSPDFPPEITSGDCPADSSIVKYQKIRKSFNALS